MTYENQGLLTILHNMNENKINEKEFTPTVIRSLRMVRLEVAVVGIA